MVKNEYKLAHRKAYRSYQIALASIYTFVTIFALVILIVNANDENSDKFLIIGISVTVAVLAV